MTVPENGKLRSAEWLRADWFTTLLHRALRLTDDAELAMRTATAAIEAKPFPDDMGTEWPRETAAPVAISLAHDIFNPKAQSILDKAMRAATRLSGRAKRDLERALASSTIQQMARRLEDWAIRWRGQMAELLTTTQLASVLAGMRQVANSVPVSPPLGVRDAFLPASLPPEDAVALIKRLRDLTYEEQQVEIYNLPPEQQAYIRTALLAEAQPPAATPPIVPTKPPPGSPERIHWPIIDRATKLLQKKNLVTRQEFDRLDSAARAKSFTVAGVSSEETLDKVRDAIAEQVSKGADIQEFRDRVLAAVEPGTFLSPAHLEVVFRTNVQTAFTDGANQILDHPFVRSGFPYAAYEPIHDDRVRPEHKELETLGIGGSNIYRRDDPTFVKFQPPWDYACRCSWNPLSVKRAAELGVAEAQRWLASGAEPARPAFVTPPSFEPPPSFRRSLSGAPLSIRLSAEPLYNWNGDDVHLAASPWQAHRGAKGGRGWKNSVTGEIRYQQNPPSPSDGGAGSTGSTASNPASGGSAPSVKNENELFQQADAGARGTLAKFGNGFKKLGAAGAWIKARTKQLYSAMEQRYGRKTAITIFAAGHVVGLATPLVILPGSTLIGMAPFAAIAETYLQVKKLFGTGQASAQLTLDPVLLAIDNAMGFEQILEAGKSLAISLQKEWKAYITENPIDGAAMAFDEAKVKRGGGKDNAGQFSKTKGSGKQDPAKQQKPEAGKSTTATHADMLGKLKKTGGFTFVAGQRKYQEIGTKGFAVSPYPDRSAVFDKPVGRDDIKKFMQANADILSKPGHAVGAWYDPASKKTYLDVSIVTGSKTNAIKLGQQHNQVAIFDFKSGSTIDTGGTGEAPSDAARSAGDGSGDRSSVGGAVPAVAGKPPPPGSAEFADQDVYKATKALAKQKIAQAPVPNNDQIAKARKELELARKGLIRAGGESRGGGSADRRRQRENLFKQFGGEERGFIACHGCGRKLHHSPASGSGMERLERGKIFVKCQGGGYQLPNLLPECFGCNRSRNDEQIRTEVKC